MGEGRYRSRSPESGGQNPHAGEWQRGADLKRVVGAWASRVCGSQGGQDRSCMTEGVERDIADDSKGGFLGLCWMAEGGGRRRPRGQSTKQTSASTQEPGQWGGEAAGPRLKSVGCGKVNGGLRGFGRERSGVLADPRRSGSGLCDCRAPRSTAARVLGYTADYTVQGTWVVQGGGGERPRWGDRERGLGRAWHGMAGLGGGLT